MGEKAGIFFDGHNRKQKKKIIWNKQMHENLFVNISVPDTQVALLWDEMDLESSFVSTSVALNQIKSY